MTSADFSSFVVTTSTCSPMRPPRVRAITFTSSTCRIYVIGLGQYWTSSCTADSSALFPPYMRFLFVRPRFCLQLPSDSTSQWTPLLLANSSYCQACSGLSPPSYRPCRAHGGKRLRRRLSRALAARAFPKTERHGRSVFCSLLPLRTTAPGPRALRMSWGSLPSFRVITRCHQDFMVCGQRSDCSH